MLVEKLFESEEIVINYADNETGNPLLVMLHGSTLNWQSMGGLIRKFEQDWHIYACDLPGHGKSGRSRSGYREVDFVCAISAFTEQCIGHPIVLLGFSVGALVSLGVAARIPQFIRAIVVLEPPLINRDVSMKLLSSNEWFTWLTEVLTSASTLEEVVTKCKESNPEMTEEVVLEQAKMIHAIDPESITYLVKDQLLENFNLAQEFSKIACPAILIRGEPELGGMCRDEDAALIEALVPQIKTVQIKGCGHEVIWGPAGEASLAHVTQFLKSL